MIAPLKWALVSAGLAVVSSAGHAQTVEQRLRAIEKKLEWFKLDELSFFPTLRRVPATTRAEAKIRIPYSRPALANVWIHVSGQVLTDSPNGVTVTATLAGFTDGAECTKSWRTPYNIESFDLRFFCNGSLGALGVNNLVLSLVPDKPETEIRDPEASVQFLNMVLVNPSPI